MRWGIWIFIVCIVSFAGFPVVADETTDDGEDKIMEEATQAFERGKYHFDKGEFKEAAEAFRMADALRPNWKLRYNLGQSEAAAKRYGLALESFEAYLSGGGDEVPTARRDEVLQEIDRLRKIVGAVNVKAPDGAKIFFDGVQRGTAPLPGAILLAAGVNHTLVVTLWDKVLTEQVVKVSGSMERQVVVEEVAPEAESEEAEMEQTEPSEEPAAVDTTGGKSGMKTAGWVITGLGGALLIGGAVTGVAALSKDNDLEPICKNGCPADKQGELDTVNNLALTTNILLGVGAATAVVGIVLVVVGAKQGKETPVSLTPAFGPQFAGAQAAWRF